MKTERSSPTATHKGCTAQVSPLALSSSGVLDDEFLADMVALMAKASTFASAVIHLFGIRPAWSGGPMGRAGPTASDEWPGIAAALASGTLSLAGDTLADARFSSHPLVSVAGIRSFVALPLVTSGGDVIGAVGVFDTVVRPPAGLPVDAVRAVARTVVSHVELRRRVTDATTEAAAAVQADIARQRQRVLHDILGHTDALIYAKDLDGRFLYLNHALTDSFAFPPDMLGRTDHDVFPPEQADLFRLNDELIARTGSGEVFEEVLTLVDGSVHTYRSTKFPVRDETGHIYAVAGVSVDVTELSAARQAHQEAEQRWHALFEHSPVAVAVVARGGFCRYANRQAARLLGATSPDLLAGRTLTDFVPDSADQASMARGVDAVLSSGLPILARRAVLHTFGGREVTVEYSGAAVVDRGEPAVQIELRDVTAAAAAEKELWASERRFHAVFDNSPVAMGISDADGRWVHTNEAFERLLLVGPGELLGAVSRDFVHSADQRMLDAVRRRPQPSTGSPGTEVRFVRRDGELRWAWISLTAAPGLGGEQWELGIAKDVTDRKAAQAELLDSQAELVAIAAVAKSVSAGDDPRQLVVDSIHELAGATSVALTEAFDDDTLVVTASAGVDLAGVRVPRADPSMTTQVWQTGQRVFLADVTTEPTVNRSLLKMDASVSALWQPVCVGGEVHAVVVVGWTHKISDPGDRAVRVVQVIAEEAGSSLQATRVRRELERSATTDPLTGLLNRRAWDGELQRLMDIAQLTGEPLALGLLDLDQFKAYNDLHGHVAGDARLAEFAAAGRDSLRRQDVFARWGGEEFIVALPACPPEQAATILNRIRASLPAGLTCSIGHTTWIPGESLVTCIGRADTALYKAKNTGRNRLVTC